MNSKILTGLVLPAYDFISGYSFNKSVGLLKQSQYFYQDKIKKYQLSRIGKLMSGLENVPHHNKFGIILNQHI